MAEKLTRLTHNMAIQLHLVAESCTETAVFSRMKEQLSLCFN
jgi:hypothetical protein